MAIGLGDQTEAFSLNAVGQSALLTMATMGASKALKLDVLRASPHSLTLIETVKNIELTIATQAVSFATGQQRHFDWRIFAASVASTVANLGAGQISSNVSIYNDALATTSASVASIGMYQLLGVHVSNEAIVANALGTFIGNQVAAQAKTHCEQFQKKKEQRKSQIPEIYAQLAESERDFIQSVLEHPHDFGKTAARQNAHPNAASNKHAPHPATANNKPTEKLPPQEHLMRTRAEKEEQMSRAARWNEEQTAAKTQPRPSQGGFWSAIDRAANSNLVTTINSIGDSVANTVGEMLDPIAQFKHARADADESIRAMRAGEIGHAGVATLKTSLDVLGLIPFASAAGKSVGYAVEAGVEIGFVVGGATALVGKGVKAFKKTNNVQFRVTRMMEKNAAYNVSPEAWFREFDAIGKYGTYVTDYRAIAENIGPIKANAKIDVGFFSRGNKVSYFRVRKLEKALGLDPKSLTEGFRLTRVPNILERHPRLPIDGGNGYFLGGGKGLPGGGPELVIDSIPTSPWR